MFSSIRVKLTLWYICVLAFIVIVFAFITYSSIVDVIRRETDENLNQTANTFIETIESEAKDEEIRQNPDEVIKEATEEFRFRDYKIAVFSNSGQLIASTINTTISTDLNSIKVEKFADSQLGQTPFRVHYQSFTLNGNVYSIYVFRSLEDQHNLTDRIRRAFSLILILLILFAGISGYFLVGRSLQPIAEMGERAKYITAANLHERLPIANTKDEIGQLAIIFNELLDRLNIEFDRQRRFMADASHELRTPLAVIRGESEIALSKDSRSISVYQESLKVINDESKRLSKIVEDLFTLARADAGELKPEFKTLYLDEMLSDCIRLIRTLSDKRNLTIEFSSDETQIKGDEALIHRLFLNLLDNAVKYNIDGGTIRVNIFKNKVNIANTGDEIPADQQKSIFDRFYRVEKSRSHTSESYTGGAGLGLSIAKTIAEMHNAALTYTRGKNGENIFSVIFPN